jgi:hypothetical protein
MLNLARRHRVLQNPDVLQCGEVWRRRYRTVRLGTPAKLMKNLHSKIGRRVDLLIARVIRYTVLCSESLCYDSMRECDRRNSLADAVLDESKDTVAP